VGGYALLAGLWVSGFDLPWPALLAAFVLGAIDDWRPMGAGVKALGQCVPAALLGLEVGGEAGIWIGLLAWVAQNAVNTFDHADGFLCALGGTAFPPLLAAPFLGVLPWNLLLRAKNRAGGDVAQAYFGDGGSLLAGVLLASQPEARWFLLVPTLDLARVVGLRLLAGQAPWVGDRRHLGHRFQDHGWNPKMGAVLALAALLPMGLASTHGHWVAALASAAVWAGLVVASRPPVAQA
ncbi:MAG TPA: hypothetical protein PLJ12_14875, partial [Planctomycetota bacterium]|nr:hypothetical protein [Planctomycetota bacterium]